MKARTSTATAWTLALLGAAALLLPARAADAQAHIEAEASVSFGASASVHVGHGGHHGHHGHGGVVVHTPAPPPPPPPPPPHTVVIVEEAPPPPPPQVTVYEHHETHAHAQPAPPPVHQQPQPGPPAEPPDPNLGFHLHLGGVAAEHVDMGGGTAAFRLRPNPHVGVDFGIGGYGGTDYNGLDRAEVPLTVDLLLYVNPQNPLQFYFVTGAGMTFAHAEGYNRFTDVFESRDFTYVGGQGGIGLEWRMGRHFALNLDGRVFLRQRVDDNDDRPEFVEYDDFGEPTGKTSDTSAGGVVNLGATFYF